jgi:hypothetical protein
MDIALLSFDSLNKRVKMKRSLKLINFKDEDPKFIEVIIEQLNANSENQEMTLSFILSQKNVDQKLFMPKKITDLEKASDLWKKTCFECFFFDEKSEQYFEVNVSLEGKYDLMSFKKYREQSSLKAPIQVSSLEIKNEQNLVIVSFNLKTEFKSTHFISPTVILHTPYEQKFFALTHDKKKPDFHQRR